MFANSEQICKVGEKEMKERKREIERERNWERWIIMREDICVSMFAT